MLGYEDLHHTIITIDIATYSNWDPRELLKTFDADLTLHPVAFEDWMVRVHQEHKGIRTPVPGYTTPEGVRL